MCHRWGLARTNVSSAGAAAQIAIPVPFAVAMVRPSTFAFDLVSDRASFRSVNYYFLRSNFVPVLAAYDLDGRFVVPHLDTALVC